MWPQLTSLCCKQNSFEDMDSSLHLLPRLHAMDLSNNNISVIRNLHHCSSLVDLNLSYNNIESLSPLRECASHLVRLVLQVGVIQQPATPRHTLPADMKPNLPVHTWLNGPCCLYWLMVFGKTDAVQGNAIRSVQGLQTLTSLTELDLRGNLLASYQEFSRLKGQSLFPPSGPHAEPLTGRSETAAVGCHTPVAHCWSCSLPPYGCRAYISGPSKTPGQQQTEPFCDRCPQSSQT